MSMPQKDRKFMKTVGIDRASRSPIAMKILRKGDVIRLKQANCLLAKKETLIDVQTTDPRAPKKTAHVKFLTV